MRVLAATYDQYVRYEYNNRNDQHCQCYHSICPLSVPLHALFKRIFGQDVETAALAVQLVNVYCIKQHTPHHSACLGTVTAQLGV
jgi:hypothetical protein